MKTQIKNWLLKHLFKAFVSTDFLVIYKNHIVMNNKKLSTNQIQVVAKQANDVLEPEHIVSLMLNDLSFIAHKKIYYDNENEFGKALLYSVDMMRGKLKSIALLRNKK